MSRDLEALLEAVATALDHDAPPISIEEIASTTTVATSPTKVVALRADALQARDHSPNAWMIAAAVLVVLAGVGALAIRSTDQSGQRAALPLDSTAAATTTPADSTTTVLSATTLTATTTALVETIGKGSSSDDVTAVQRRLSELGFGVGPIDGVFGSTTQQAVWAFEKLVNRVPRSQVTGRVSNAMWQQMQAPVVIAPRRPTGTGSTHMEIYVPEQVAIVFVDDKPALIAHISTGEQNPDGTPKNWCETLTYDTGANGELLDAPVTKQECADAKTPGGVFTFTRRYDGKRVGPLGGMMNPVYFNYGIAVHGADNVPLEPASHGCVRINQTLAKVFPSLVSNGDRVYVWGQDGKEPEQYTTRESLPSFNYADPSATTTVAPTTVAATSPLSIPVPPTLVPPTATVEPTTTSSTPATTTSAG
jgi:lipoprotein-anchoring transpeptidase ErfK/SrfK